MTALVLLLAFLLSASPPIEALAALEQLRAAAAPDPARVRGILEAMPDAASDVAADPAARCRDAFAAAEAYRAAAALLRDPALADAALARFRQLRVDHLGMAMAELGHVGEARVHRDRGDFDAARAALLPLEAPGADPRLAELARRERLEILLREDPARAVAELDALPDAEANAWIRARAEAALGNRAAAIAALDRAPSAPAIERLLLLVRLDALDAASATAWAALLRREDRTEEAHRVLAERRDLDADGARLLAAIEEEAGRPRAAAEAWLRRDAIDPDPAARFAAARCLAEAGERDRAATLHLSVADDVAADPRLRRAALSRWGRLAEPEAVAPALAAREALVAEDADLLLLRAIATAEHDRAAAIADLDRAAAEATAPALRRAATIALAALEADDRAALLRLEDLVAADPAAAGEPALRRARARRLLALGILDDAAQDALADPEALDAPLLLAIAEGFAERHGDGIDPGDRASAVRLVRAAVAASRAAPEIARHGGAILVRLGADGEADRLLAGVTDDEALRLRAELALRRDDAEAALALLEGTTGPESDLLRGRGLAELGDADAALAALRAARRALPEGTARWWDATLEVARIHLLRGAPEAADALLRAAEIMHPPAEGSVQRRRLEDLRRSTRP